jgi:hypothetical protein
MEFLHKQQIEHLETLKRNVSSPLERQMFHDILVSVLDSSSHCTMTGNMVRIEMNFLRYKKYMKLVVEPERFEGPREADEPKIISISEFQTG